LDEGIVDEENNKVYFYFKEEARIEYNFYIKATAEGNEVHWSEHKKITTVCGPESAGIYLIGE